MLKKLMKLATLKKAFDLYKSHKARKRNPNVRAGYWD